MKDYSYVDPYEGLQMFVAIEDDDEESWSEALAWLEQSRKEIQNQERKERRHALYHLEQLLYEGIEYASSEDVDQDVANVDEEKCIDAFLKDNLTELQYRRFLMYMDGIRIREIARLEDADYSSVYESISAAKKKLRKIYENTPSNTPSKCPYSEG